MLWILKYRSRTSISPQVLRQNMAELSKIISDLPSLPIIFRGFPATTRTFLRGENQLIKCLIFRLFKNTRTLELLREESDKTRVPF